MTGQPSSAGAAAGVAKPLIRGPYLSTTGRHLTKEKTMQFATNRVHRKRVHRNRASRLTLAALLTGSLATLGLAATSAAANAQITAATVSTGSTTIAAAGDFGYFTGNGVRIWSRPGTGTVRGLGYKNQGFCVDSRSGSYYHGRNTATGVTGWASVTYVHVALALEC